MTPPIIYAFNIQVLLDFLIPYLRPSATSPFAKGEEKSSEARLGGGYLTA
jgi:hypothetical protein